MTANAYSDISFLKRLFNSLEDTPVIILNSSGEILFANSGCKKLCGYAPADVQGELFENFLADYEKKGVPHRLLSGSGLNNALVESKVRTKQGEEKNIYWEVVRPDPEDEEGLVVCLGKEEPAEKAREDPLLEKYREARETAEKYRTLFEYAYDAILFSRFQSGRIFEANPEAENLLGYKTEELPGKKLGDILVTGEVSELKSRLEESRFHYREEQNLETKKGTTLVASMSTALIEYRGRQTILTLFHDMTKRIELENELRDRAESLKESNEKLEEIIQIISHDLKEPLRSIGTYSDMLATQNRGVLPEGVLQKMDNLKQNASQLKEMMDDVSNLTRITMSGSKTRIEVPELVREIKGELAINGSGAEIEVDAGFPEVRFDRFQLKVVLKNLISNALKYNSPPKRIRVGFEQGEEQGEIVIFVRDNGDGVPEEYQARVFEMFEQLEPAQDTKGMGAGLAFCKRIVRSHEGEITLESEPGQGSTFYFTVPAP